MESTLSPTRRSVVAQDQDEAGVRAFTARNRQQLREVQNTAQFSAQVDHS